ncbi:MAG: T9SS type A sorting domain-containing protein [Ferruginibacter sp.]
MRASNLFLRMLFVMLMTWLFATCVKAQTNVYVDVAAAGSNDGTSWSNAYTDLNTALVTANAGTGQYNLYVAQGSYVPTSATLLASPNIATGTFQSGDKSFTIKRAGIYLYGGYSSGGAARNVKTNTTTINASGCFHGMIITGANSATDSIVVDGFNISSGNASGTGSTNLVIGGATIFKSQGGGVNINSNTAKIAFRSVNFISNGATYGGGIYTATSDLYFLNCVFQLNTANTGNGGAMNIASGSTNFVQCVLFANTATNYFQASAGGLFMGGAANATILNSTIALNTAPGTASSAVSILNSGTGLLTMKNSIVWATDLTKNVVPGNYAINNCNVGMTSGTLTGAGNTNADPLFFNSSDGDGADNIWGTSDDGVSLSDGSFVYTTGNNADVPAYLLQDITGSNRIQATVEMGAYEKLIGANYSCGGSGFNLYASNGALSYSWSGPNGFTSTQQNPVVPINSFLQSGTYTVTGTFSGGVVGSAGTNITISTWYIDQDNDGHGNQAISMLSCSQPSGFVSSGDDCDDNDATNYPTAIDPAFLSGTGFNGSVSPAVVQTDGKIIIGGSFSAYNGTAITNLVRLNSNGSIDNSFVTGTGPNSTVNAIALQADGKIIIAGAFTTYNGVSANRIARLNTDGSLDNTFITGTGTNTTISSLMLQADGKIMIGGSFTIYNSTARNRIARLNTDGTLDNSFAPGATGTNSTVNSIAQQSDGKIMIGGAFTTYNSTTKNRIARLNTDGSLDNTFNVGTGADNAVTSIALQPDGKILVVGAFANYNASAASRIMRLNADGSRDNSFTTGTGPNGTVNKVVLQVDGKILIAGSFTTYNGVAALRIIRLNSNGTKDIAPGGTNSTVNSIVVQTDAKIILSGSFTTYNSVTVNGIARFKLDCASACVAPNVPTINATATSTCASQNTTLSIITGSLNSATAWKWYSGSCAGTLVGTGTSIIVNPATTTTYYVRGEGGCVAAGNCASVTINVNQPSTSTTNISICANALPYSWNGLTFTTTGSQTAHLTNAVGCDSAATLNLTVNPLPSIPTATVVQPTCTIATGTINVTAPLGEDYTYSIGGVYQSNPSFTTVNPGTYTLSVQSTAGCFAALTSSVTVDPQPFIPAAPTTTGFTNVCPYTGTATQITYTASAVGATSYTWSIPPTNVAIVSGQGTANLTVTFGSGFPAQNNKQFRVSAVSACGTSPLMIFSTFTQQPNTASPITGPTSVCELIGTSSTATYTIPAVAGATEYSWSIPAGTSITHPNGTGVNDTTVRLTFLANFTGGNISVITSNNCGAGGTRTLAIGYVRAATPGLINGPTNACAYMEPSGVAATYSIVPVAGATSYTWTTPAGASVTHNFAAGANDCSITVVYPNGFTSGNITVTATNGCGTSSVRSLSITKLNVATPGVFDVIQTGFCGDAGGRVYTYTLAAMPANATAVNWTVPTAAGAVLLSGQGTTSIAVSYPSTAVEGNVTAQSSNNCDVSVIRSLFVKMGVCATTFAKGPVNETGNKVISIPARETRTGAKEDVDNKTMDVTVFPNPTINDFKIQVLTTVAEKIYVRISDMQGRVLKQLVTVANQINNIGEDLKAGTYILEIKQGTIVKTTKLVKF